MLRPDISIVIQHDPLSEVIDGQLIVARAQRSALFVPADHPFNQIPPTVHFGVEGLVTWLIFPAGDHGLDVVSPKPLTNPRITVAFVASHLPWPARPRRRASR